MKIKWSYCECGCKCNEVKVAGKYFSIYDSLHGWYYLAEQHNARLYGNEKLTEEQVNQKIYQGLKSYYKEHRAEFKMLEKEFGGN